MLKLLCTIFVIGRNYEIHYVNNIFSCIFIDIDECKSTPCDKNAACVNTDGSFTCTCNTGYSGDGFNCSGKIIGLNIVQIIILLWNDAFIIP